MRGGHAGVACVEGCLLGGLGCEWSIHSGVCKKLPILIQVSRNNTIQHSIHSMEHPFQNNLEHTLLSFQLIFIISLFLILQHYELCL